VAQVALGNRDDLAVLVRASILIGCIESFMRDAQPVLMTAASASTQ
jgi:hypothetical protein